MSARLLVVDDELHILKAAEFKFKRQGYHVETAYDGEQAWEMLKVNPPDMLITDLQMPRMNGLELIRKMRNDERFRDIPAILLTAKGYELDHEDIKSSLFIYDVVFKPFSPRDLCKRVGEALAQYDERQQAVAVTGAPSVDFVAGQTGEDRPSTTPLPDASDTT